MRALAARRVHLLFAALLCLPGGLSQAVQDDEGDPFIEWRAQYEEYQKRLPFLMHARGRSKFAQTQDPRALEILARSYARPADPVDQSQYIIAAIATRHCRGEEHVSILDAWRGRHKKPQDAWLWYRTLAVHHSHNGPDQLVELLRAKTPTFLKAATLEALASQKEPDILELIPEMLDDLPRRGVERAVILESLARCLYSQSWRLGSEEFTGPAERLITMMDDKNTLERTKVTFARYLGKMFKTQGFSMEAEPWLRTLAAGAPIAVNTRKSKYAQPKFFNLTATGRKICYVLDMSDSMCAPIDVGHKPKGPTTGGGAGAKKKKKKKDDDLPTPGQIAWWKIEIRFDLAREHLKASLLTLSPDRQFSVIWFGDGAGLLESTPGMIAASRKNVEKVIRELDSITMGDPNPRRPHGTLRGLTNLHGGLHRAFKLKKRGLTKGAEYVDASTFEEGCDSIFLLSDGDPTWDDWAMMDTNYNEDTIGDPESRVPGVSTPNLYYQGPYSMWEHTIDDTERLNLFRKIEFLCIGIGDVQMYQLDRLAKKGILGGKTHEPGK